MGEQSLHWVKSDSYLWLNGKGVSSKVMTISPGYIIQNQLFCSFFFKKPMNALEHKTASYQPLCQKDGVLIWILLTDQMLTKNYLNVLIV